MPFDENNSYRDIGNEKPQKIKGEALFLNVKTSEELYENKNISGAFE